MPVLAQLSDWWQLSLSQSLLVIALILFIVDIFFSADFPSHIAYILVSFVVGTELPYPPLLKVLFGVVAWFACVSFHYFLWRKVLDRFANKVVAPDKYNSSLSRFFGREVTVRERDGKRMITIEGDLYPCKGESLADGDRVVVTGEDDGVLVVSAQKTEVK